MQRSCDSRFYPNVPAAKTKGIPVKLKVPTHVEVKIVESFFIHNSSGAAAIAKSKVDKAKAEKAKANFDTSLAQLTEMTNAGLLPTEADKKNITDLKVANDNAQQAANDSAAAVKEVTAKYSEAKVMCSDKEIRNLSVETSLAYTEKVFTVDFRRPAGGLLDLKSVNMDNQQYFAAIQAEYQEQTVQQINSAIGTLATGKQSTVTSTGAAIPTPVDQSSTPLLGSDQRVVAMARFDISDPDWESRLHAFIDTHVTGCFQNCPGDNCPQIR